MHDAVCKVDKRVTTNFLHLDGDVTFPKSEKSSGRRSDGVPTLLDPLCHYYTRTSAQCCKGDHGLGTVNQWCVQLNFLLVQDRWRLQPFSETAAATLAH